MAGRSGWLIAFLTRAEPRNAPPTGWALAFDAAVAVGAAIGTLYEMVHRSVAGAFMVTVPAFSPLGGPVLMPVKRAGGLLMAASGQPSWLLLVGAALTALPLAARRIYPIGVWLAIAAAIVAVHSVYVPPVALGTAVYAAYSAITYSRYRNLAIGMVSVVTIAVAATLGNELPRFPGRLTAVFAILPAGAAGLGFRVLRRRLADSTARLRVAADEAKAATERALTAERSRIASELHDVVTHNVSVMIVQAGAARKILASSPADAEDALLAVESTGREAMTELRNLLGLLSPAADGSDPRGGPTSPVSSVSSVSSAPSVAAPVPAALSPQPGLGELNALIGRVTAAGLPVTLSVTGTVRALPPGADLAAYRVVQEGLTNVLRHADHASTSVAVRWGDALELTVSNEGTATSTGTSSETGAAGAASDGDAPAPGAGRGLLGAGRGLLGAGRGLLGLRERLALYGGALTAGQLPDGGWRLSAVLPLSEAQSSGLGAASPEPGSSWSASSGPGAAG